MKEQIYTTNNGIKVNSEELKPCPFCGCPEIVIKEAKTVIIECVECGVIFIRLSRQDALSAWERRAI